MIIIPCYYEINTILLIVEVVKGSPLPWKEIIIVNNSSNTGARQVLKENYFEVR